MPNRYAAEPSAQGDRKPGCLRRVHRPAFTLPELLVAAALSMAIMALIAVAFQKAIDIFRNMRAVGSMEDKLRSAENVIIRDLASEHFGGTFRPGLSGPFLRDQRLDLSGWAPPDEGYFRIVQLSKSTNEGVDGDNVPSFAATNHSLQFTVKLPGRRAEEYFRCSDGLLTQNPPTPPDFASAGQFVSRWAEVGYFLYANGQNANGTTLYTLYRRQQVLLSVEGANLMAALHTPIPSGLTPSVYPNTSVGANGTANTSATVTLAANRLQLVPLSSYGSTYAGDDILLTNVISFEVKLNWSTLPITSTAPPGASPANIPSPSDLKWGNAAWKNYFQDWPFAIPQPLTITGGAGPVAFDTGSRLNNAAINWDDPTSFGTATITGPSGGSAAFKRIRVNAVQIRLRIWDSSTQTARQITIIQDV